MSVDRADSPEWQGAGLVWSSSPAAPKCVCTLCESVRPTAVEKSEERNMQAPGERVVPLKGMSVSAATGLPWCFVQDAMQRLCNRSCRNDFSGLDHHEQVGD